MHRVRLFALVGMVGALWAFIFSAISTVDYAAHLDRGLHDLHCSFIPGMSAEAESEGCRVALNSPYAAVFEERLWGGVPISLFGLGCFAFLFAYAAYVALWGGRATRDTAWSYALLACSPALVSAVMLSISWFHLGTLCQTCAGIYAGSAVLAISGIGVARACPPERSASDGFIAVFGALLSILVFTLAPSLVYAGLAPDHGPFVGECGRLGQQSEKHGALLRLGGANAKKPAVFFEDPLCPTCKALHDRLDDAGVIDRLAIDLALFPLDDECNWMLDQPLHPGACQLSRAILCAAAPAQMLDWAYANQSALSEAGKRGRAELDRMIVEAWGKPLLECMQAKSTTQRLNRHLHFAVDNAIPVSTPQVFIDGQRLCDEDIDIGLMFALRRIAPEVVP